MISQKHKVLKPPPDNDRFLSKASQVGLTSAPFPKLDAPLFERHKRRIDLYSLRALGLGLSLGSSSISHSILRGPRPVSVGGKMTLDRFGGSVVLVKETRRKMEKSSRNLRLARRGVKRLRVEVVEEVHRPMRSSGTHLRQGVETWRGDEGKGRVRWSTPLLIKTLFLLPVDSI